MFSFYLLGISHYSRGINARIKGSKNKNLFLERSPHERFFELCIVHHRCISQVDWLGGCIFCGDDTLHSGCDQYQAHQLCDARGETRMGNGL